MFVSLVVGSMGQYSKHSDRSIKCCERAAGNCCYGYHWTTTVREITTVEDLAFGRKNRMKQSDDFCRALACNHALSRQLLCSLLLFLQSLKYICCWFLFLFLFSFFSFRVVVFWIQGCDWYTWLMTVIELNSSVGEILTSWQRHSVWPIQPWNGVCHITVNADFFLLVIWLHCGQWPVFDGVRVNILKCGTLLLLICWI